MVESRIFVCDPACVQEIGHNVHALRYFKSTFLDRFTSVHPVCCNALPDDVAAREGFTKHYNFYYGDYFPGVRHENPKGLDTGHVFLDDALETIATRDAIALLERFSIGADDIIFFPHLDFYGVVGLLNALELKRPAADRPVLYLRFIGVMENATKRYKVPCNELLFRLRTARARGTRFKASAETPRYADLISNVLEATVSVTGYPLMEQPISLPLSGPFYFYCPGSARADKGYFELLDICTSVRRDDPECTIRFITQTLPPHELRFHLRYTRQLYAVPGVEIQEGAVSPADMLDTYRRSHAVLLPYARDIYEYRGSAVLMEAAAYGRRALAYQGNGFSNVIEYYGLGQVVNSQVELVQSIFKLASDDRTSLEIQARQAGFRFHADNSNSYKSWLQSDD